MVVGGEGVAHAVLVVVVLAVSDVLCVGHGHLLATVPGTGTRDTGQHTVTGTGTLVNTR